MASTAPTSSSTSAPTSSSTSAPAPAPTGAAPAAIEGGGGDTVAFSSTSVSVTNNQAGRQPPSPFSSEPSDASDDELTGGSTQGHRQLPSLSSAALLQLRSGRNHANERSDRQRRRSRSRNRSRSREQRWSRGDIPAPKVLDSDATDRGEARSSFSGSVDDTETRIMFHGREVFADDLVGLRVAKTFAGHGRFLGQVVRFDDPTALYTIVYADGDAEELSIESTIQILIQDEIERADPALPPIAPAYAKDAYPTRTDSPDKSGTQAGPSTTSALLQPHHRHHHPTSDAVSAVSGAPTPRPALHISEREAQLVVGLFETHALPVLLREGWKVQTSASGAELRYYAPPGNYPGAGRVFGSALAVVELIASDERMLAACFPTNVHAVILSLFTDLSRTPTTSSVSARKRVSTLQADSEAYDAKRLRSGRDDMSGPPPGSHFHGAMSSIHHGSSSSSSSQHHSDKRGYHSDDVAAMDREQDVYPPDRVPPGRFGHSSSVPTSRDGGASGVRAHHRDVDEYRRMAGSGGGGGSVPIRSGAVDARRPSSSSVDVDEYRRQYTGSPGWQERDMSSTSRGLGPHSSGPPPHDGHQGLARPDAMYYTDNHHRHHPSRFGMPYQYQDMRGSPTRAGGSSAEQYRPGTAGRASAPAPSRPDRDSLASAHPRESAPTAFLNARNRASLGALERGTSGTARSAERSSSNQRGGGPLPAAPEQSTYGSFGRSSADRATTFEPNERSHPGHSAEQAPTDRGDHHQRHEAHGVHSQHRLASKGPDASRPTGRASPEPVEQRSAVGAGLSMS